MRQVDKTTIPATYTAAKTTALAVAVTGGTKGSVLTATGYSLLDDLILANDLIDKVKSALRAGGYAIYYKRPRNGPTMKAATPLPAFPTLCANATAVLPMVITANLTQAYQAVLDIEKWKKTNVRILGTYDGYINTVYPLARRDLVNTIGFYCSYCEAPLYYNAHVEHKLPKSLFPRNAMEWSNFLLACNSCNAGKGVTPNYGFLTAQGIATPPLVINPLTNESTAITTTPGVDWADVNTTFVDFSYELTRETYTFSAMAGTPRCPRAVFTQAKDIPDSAAQVSLVTGHIVRGNVLVSNLMVQIRYVTTDANNTINNEGSYYQFKVAPKVSGAIPAAAASRADITMKMAKLNATAATSGDPTAVDRRAELRTCAWLNALLAAQRINTVTTALGAASPQLTALNALIQRTAAATGFWSTWVCVFKQQGFSDAQVKALFNPPAPATLWNAPYFPGTVPIP